MADLSLFTDGSVNPQLKIGYGAYLLLPEENLSQSSLRASVKVKKFDETSSTRLELQTMLWALNDICTLGRRVIIYTDSQNIMGLPGRRSRLEKNDYWTNKQTRIRNFVLYQEFYRLMDQLDCSFVKVKGHKGSNQKDEIDRLFSLVDKASRNALRRDNQGPIDP